MSSTSPAAQNERSSRGVWPSLVPYAGPPLAAFAGILFPFRDLIAKSAQQQGLPVPRISVQEGLKEGLKAARVVGILVGTQMVAQGIVEKALSGDSDEVSLLLTAESSVLVAAGSVPVIAAFNGRTLGWNAITSLRKLSVPQGGAIVVQEAWCVLGMSAADQLAAILKRKLAEKTQSKVRDSKAIDYFAALFAGGAGGLASQPANTALTRWQKGLRVEHPSQLMWGTARRTRALACFSLFYKMGKDALNSTIKSSE